MLPGLALVGMRSAADDSSSSPVFLRDASAIDGTVSPVHPSAFWEMNVSGNVNASSGAGYAWLLIGAAADYEVRATLLSGSVSIGATGVWLPLSSTRRWTLTRSNVGSSVAELAIEVRSIATGLVVATASVTLEAEMGL
jgi:hypothetical protein